MKTKTKGFFPWPSTNPKPLTTEASKLVDRMQSLSIQDLVGLKEAVEDLITIRLS